MHSQNKLAVVITAGKTSKSHKLHKTGSRAAKLPAVADFVQQCDPAVSPYPCGIVDPKYSADDVLLQVGRDEFHLDGSVAVDSVFRPVLWTQLNKGGTYKHTDICTRSHAGTAAHTHRKTHGDKKQRTRMMIH